MAEVTFQVLEGLERGEIFWNLPTPVTIGREEDNHIRLNDERVSRFHAKVQEDNGCVILTDLESTNGTRVNGHAVKMRVLQVGDQLLIGRCLLVFGSPEQIAAKIHGNLRLNDMPDGDQTIAARLAPKDEEQGSGSGYGQETEDEPFPQGPPELPQNLSPLHTAQVSDLLAFVHARILRILLAAEERADSRKGAGNDFMAVPQTAWHELQQLEMQLSLYLKGIADPGRGP
jgi:hypothetical protein